MECPACHSPQPDVEGARFCAICGTLLPRYNEQDPLIGRLVGGRFRITTLIAIGGMGRVYGGEQKMGATLRRVAVKVLLADYTVNPDVVSRFMRECSTVSELEHPNTIKFYDFGQTDDGHLYIAMEYVAGPSLATVMKNEGSLAPERVDRIVAQICGSLQEAHDKGFIHRDLKPENILLSTHSGEEDFVKVLDFGIAKRAGANVPKITQEGMVLGSPPYMSPEQFTRGELDARSDIYSLAIVAFKALVGKKPFKAEKAVEWATEHMTSQPLPFESTPAGAAVPWNMKRAIYHALAKKALDRPQTMREFYAEFTLGNVRSSLLGRSQPPVAGAVGASPARGGSFVPPPAPLPEGLGADPAPKVAGGTLVMDPSRAQQTQLDDPQRHAGSSVPTNIESPPPPPQVVAPPAAPVPPAPPPPQPTRVELVPPTVREPVPPTVRGSGGRGGVIAGSIAGGVLIVGAALLIARFLIGGAGTGGRGVSPSSSGTSAATAVAVPAPPTVATPTATALAPATAAPTPTAVPTGPAPTPGADACRETINAALADNCPLALHYRKLCPDTHPNHRDAHVAYELHCRGQ